MKLREHLSNAVKSTTEFVTETISKAVGGIVKWTSSAVLDVLKNIPLIPGGKK